MNEVVYQGTGHNIKELLLGGVSAEDLLKWVLSLWREKQNALRWNSTPSRLEVRLFMLTVLLCGHSRLRHSKKDCEQSLNYSPSALSSLQTSHTTLKSHQLRTGRFSVPVTEENVEKPSDASD
jgi:hypothetical protein